MKTNMKLQDESYLDIFEGLFADINLEGSTYLSKYAFTNRYNKGQNLFIQNSIPFGIFIVKSGNIRITNIDSQGNETFLRLTNVGDVLGYSSLIGNMNFNQTATAIDNSEVTFLAKSHCLSLMKENPDIYIKLITQLTKIINKTEKQLCSSYQKNIRERTAELILSLKETHGTFENNKWHINIKINREDMATMIGTTTESLIRCMTELKDAKIIEENHKKLFIINEEQLIEWAHI